MLFVLSCMFQLVVNVFNGKAVLKEALAMSVFYYLQNDSAVGWVVIDKLDEGPCPRCTVCLQGTRIANTKHSVKMLINYKKFSQLLGFQQ